MNAAGAKEIDDDALEENAAETQGVEQDHLVLNDNDMVEAEPTKKTLGLVKDRADSKADENKTGFVICEAQCSAPRISPGVTTLPRTVLAKGI